MQQEIQAAVYDWATTFTIFIRSFLIQIAYNIGNVVNTDKTVRTNGAALDAVVECTVP